ncbi:MAG TPA: putative peptidoglycan glycosyltransferase FtsW [Oscillospiraceae bacterium]|nr:putative peptidoglycan glycosyltransferase FtsW [Oscillospiraceae bacterium]HRW56405.1 putative peptidoglycan glycosyltransferase FtsW [Oscillospiraceae bacterium]
MKPITIDLQSFIPVAAAKEKLFVRKKQRGPIDATFLILVLILLTFGLVMLFSASYAYAYYNDGDSFYYIKRQLFFAIIGIVAMLFIGTSINFRILQKYSLLLFAVSIFLLVAVLFVRDQSGFSRWLYIGHYGFQPSEIAKFAIIVLFAHFAAQNADKMKTFQYGVLPFGICLGLVAVLMILEPHVSGTILIGLLGMMMMWFGGTNWRWFALIAGVGFAAVAVVVFTPNLLDYAQTRVEMWQDPYLDYSGSGYQTIQSLIAIGSGGLWGTGLGNSKQKYLYIPEPQNDFIFAVVCEELGFIGATIIVILFALLVWRGFIIAVRSTDRFGSLLAAGCTFHVGIQAALNIAVVTNSIPNTGISLPFFSSGGTALLMLLGEMGVILSVSRTSTLEKQ